MQLLRQLEHEQARFWERPQTTIEPVVEEKDCDPALLSGWTDRNISLWDISEGNGKPGLKSILVALCKNKKNWDKIGYVLFSGEAVTAAGLTLTPNNGKTGDSRVDLSNTHFEIKAITGKKLCTLIHTVANGAFEIGFFKKTEMEKIIYDGYQQSQVRHVTSTSTIEGSPSILVSSGTQVVAQEHVSNNNLTPPTVANDIKLPDSSSSTTN